MHHNQYHKKITDKGVLDFVNQVFTKLNSKNISYVLIRNYEDFPNEIEGDIDILILPENLNSVKEILTALEKEHNIEAFHSGGNEPHFKKSYFLGKNKKDIVTLDFQYYLGWAGFKYSTAKPLLDKRKSYKSFYILEDEDQLFMYLTHSIIHKKYFYKKYIESMNLIIKSRNPENLLEKYLSGKLLLLYRKLLNDRDYKQLLKTRLGLLFHLSWTYKRNLIRPLIVRLKWLYNKMPSFIFPSGVLVAFIGPDGSGKTTILNTIYHDIRYSPIPKVKSIQMGFQKRGVLHTDIIYKKYIKWKGANLILPVISIIDFYLRYFLKIRPILAVGGVVLADRYIYNSGFGRFKIAKSKFLKRLLFFFTPKPDICYVVHRDFDDIITSRGNRDARDLANYYEIITEIKLDCMIHLNNNNLNDVRDQCMDNIIKIYNQKRLNHT